MNYKDNIKVIGKLNKHQDIATELIDKFKILYPDVQGEIYLGYPIYVDEVTKRKTNIDIAIISKIGVFVINILDAPVIDYGTIQDDIYAKVESKFKKHAFLFKKRKLLFEFIPITLALKKIEPIEDYFIANSVEEIISIIEKNANQDNFSDQLYSNIISGLQEAYGINNHIVREGVKEGTKAYAINELSYLVEKYGNSQMEAILSSSDGIQRIRGMAGSGKTIVLARKAVELHTAHPDWDIVVTYSTRSLKGQLEELIRRFYAMRNDGALYNDKKLRIIHSWGSSKSRGVYYEICIEHGISPLSLNEAREKYQKKGGLFSSICKDLLDNVIEFKKMYDCILVDEAQDFDINFLQLCSKVLGTEQRLVYAYDELQALNEDQMPNPEEIFGHSVNSDTPLTVCYRNQRKVIVTAHAIGMGLYRKEGLIQLPGNSEVWPAIGYFSDKPIIEGEKVTLYRTKETSPDYLNANQEDLIIFNKFDDALQMYKRLLDSIEDDIEGEQLSPRDIIVIDMNHVAYQSNCGMLNEYKSILDEERKKHNERIYPFRIHFAGASNPEDFFRDNSIVYSSVRRAKGNESYMVYIVNAQNCINSLQRRFDRNSIFTAITRSKGWVRVYGYGEDMDDLCEEFELIKNNDFKLYFEHYPTKDEMKKIFINNKDAEYSDIKTIDRTKELIERLSNDGNISKVQLMKKLFDADTGELIQMLKESESEYK